MTPSERIKKGFELSEWSARLNKDYKKELNRRLKNYYLLKQSAKDNLLSGLSKKIKNQPDSGKGM